MSLRGSLGSELDNLGSQLYRGGVAVALDAQQPRLEVVVSLAKRLHRGVSLGERNVPGLERLLERVELRPELAGFGVGPLGRGFSLGSEPRLFGSQRGLAVGEASLELLARGGQALALDRVRLGGAKLGAERVLDLSHLAQRGLHSRGHLVNFLAKRANLLLLLPGGHQSRHLPLQFLHLVGAGRLESDDLLAQSFHLLLLALLTIQLSLQDPDALRHQRQPRREIRAKLLGGCLGVAEPLLQRGDQERVLRRLGVAIGSGRRGFGLDPRLDVRGRGAQALGLRLHRGDSLVGGDGSLRGGGVGSSLRVRERPLEAFHLSLEGVAFLGGCERGSLALGLGLGEAFA